MMFLPIGGLFLLVMLRRRMNSVYDRLCFLNVDAQDQSRLFEAPSKVEVKMTTLMTYCPSSDFLPQMLP